VSWRFKDKTPVWAYVIAALLLGNIVLQIITMFWIPSHAPMRPDVTHAYPIHISGAAVYFVQPWLGAYADYGLYAGFALLALFGLLLWLNRSKLERVS
jgi:hypothetical protein